MPIEQDAERIFAGWVARRQLDEAEPYAELLQAHPEQARELDLLADRLRRLEEVLSLIGMCDTVHAPERLLEAERREQLEAQLAQLGRAREGNRPYTTGSELGRGGTARVVRAWDMDLEREVAMKVLRKAPGDAPTNHLWRFLVEARLTGALDHPGIVPVHELGLDERGHPYFTMRLVEGPSLDRAFEQARTHEGGWTLTRALEVLIKVCDTMAFAHARGVVHRDLKPANIMVGEYGETYVVDWGLAWVTSDREPGPAGEPPTSALDTGAGDVIGTPAYMPPEQASGTHHALGPTADVYALGAMLYELLAGRIPFEEEGVLLTGKVALEQVIEGPPDGLSSVAGDAPPELIAVCEKAMSRQPEDRYSDASELAAELRAFVEGRVVYAHMSGPWAELYSWLRRNRTIAATTAAAAILVGGLLASLFLMRARNRAELSLLVGPTLLDSIEQRADQLYPAWPENERALSDLLVEVRNVLARREEFRAERERLAALGTTPDDPTAGIESRRDLSKDMSALRTQAELLERSIEEPFEIDGVQLRGDTVEERLANTRWSMIEIAARALPGDSVVIDDQLIYAEYLLLGKTLRRLDVWASGDRYSGLLRDLEHRLDWARTVRRITMEEPKELWDRAAEEVAVDPRYRGLELAPQLGLVPIGPDPDSGLQEFAHLASGTPAIRGPEGQLKSTGDTGMVFVLVPPGEYEAPNHSEPETPSTVVPIDAFLLSKYEVTQGQWRRLTGDRPSLRQAGTILRDGTHITEVYPLESVDWNTSQVHLARLGLMLPSTAQWQYAARAGTSGSRWTGEEWASLSGLENLADTSTARISFQIENSSTALELDDGHAWTCPVDALAGNPWGLHQMLGNVSEWCADIYLRDTRWPYEDGNGLRRPPITEGNRVSCGANWFEATPRHVRSTHRNSVPPDRALPTRGLRAARALR